MIHESDMWLLFLNEDLAIEFAMNHNLIPRFRVCCDKQIELKTSRTAKNKTPTFRCTQGKCRKEYSMRKGTFFEHSRLPIGVILMIIFCYVKGMTSIMSIKDKVKIISNTTAVDWLSYCREVSEIILERNPIMLGGENRVVELDESVLVRRKYNRGRRVNECWVFCLYEVVTRQAIALRVNDRTKETLYPIIQRYILPGTTIYTDGAAVYRGLADLGYQHYTCNHSIGEWVNTATGATVNHVESFWQKLKTANKVRYGTHRSTIDSHICEHLYFHRYGRNVELYLEHIASIYDLN